MSNQMMRTMTESIREMVDMISVRNHIYTMVNGPRTALISREEEKELREFANDLDREVVTRSLMIKNYSSSDVEVGCLESDEDPNALDDEQLPPQVAAQIKDPAPATKKVVTKKVTKKSTRKTPKDANALVEAMMAESEAKSEDSAEKESDVKTKLAATPKTAKKGLVRRSSGEN